jgi:hypothetical protein
LGNKLDQQIHADQLEMNCAGNAMCVFLFQ